MDRLVGIPLGHGLEDLIPASERALLGAVAERPRVIGVGTLEKWDPRELAMKREIEIDVIGRGKTPQEAAAFALAHLAKRGIAPTRR